MFLPAIILLNAPNMAILEVITKAAVQSCDKSKILPNNNG